MNSIVLEHINDLIHMIYLAAQVKRGYAVQL